MTDVDSKRATAKNIAYHAGHVRLADFLVKRGIKLRTFGTTLTWSMVGLIVVV